MFIPPAFSESDLSKLHAFIAQHSFAILVSQVDGLPFAPHIPILLEPGVGPYGTLVGHFARANRQWQQVAGQTAMAIFSGPHTYVSPTWYEASNVVPTWNYTAVHAYGQVELIESETSLRDILKASVQKYEQGMPEPWSIDESSPFIEKLTSQIVGFRMPIEKLEGKFKLNQHHPAERRHKVIRALEHQADENALALAALMRTTLPAEERGS